MSKKVTTRNPEKYEYAYLLYMQRVSQKEICEKVGVTPTTLQKWRDGASWQAKRAAKSISIDDIICKTLSKINTLLDADDFSADNFAKAVSQLKKLQQGATIDDKINTLSEFGDYLIRQIGVNKEVTTELVQKLTSLQDIYILNIIKNGTESK